MSIALCDHPEIDRILDGLLALGYSISPASLRLDDLTDSIVRRLRESGEKSITIAPETGSDRLRRVINKTVTNDEILAATELIFANGIDNLKLYYMIGLPTETDEDLDAIRDMTVAMRDIMMKHARPRGHIGRIVGSVNPLIPKPGTAYQWLPMEDPAITDRKGKRLRHLLSGIDNVYFNIKSERHSYYQALLSLGDRRVADAIEAAERNGGNWRAAVAEVGLDADFYIFRDRSNDTVLPWDIIDGGMKASFFQSEFRKSLREEWTLPPKRQKENLKLLPVLDSRPSRTLRRSLDRARVEPAEASADSVSNSPIRLQDQIANAALRRRVGDRAQKGETAPLAVDGELPRGKRDVPSVAGLALPHGEADQLEALEGTGDEVQLGVRKLAWRVAFVVRYDFDCHGFAPRDDWQQALSGGEAGQGAGRPGRDRRCPPKCQR